MITTFPASREETFCSEHESKMLLRNMRSRKKTFNNVLEGSEHIGLGLPFL